MSTLTGSGKRDGTVEEATLNNPYALVIDESGSIYFSEKGAGSIRKIHPSQHLNHHSIFLANIVSIIVFSLLVNQFDFFGVQMSCHDYETVLAVPNSFLNSIPCPFESEENDLFLYVDFC